MLVLKLEQNLFQELNKEKIESVREWAEGDSVFRQIDVDFYEGVLTMTVEKRKYPYFYKYYLYLGENLEKNVELRSEAGAKFILAFYKKYCPDYLKNPIYNEEIGMKPEEYFYMEKVPGESMQHFIPGKGLEEEVNGQQEDVPAYSGSMEGYHEFTEEEKSDISGQLDALKDQFADQLKELEALMGKKVQ